MLKYLLQTFTFFRAIDAFSVSIDCPLLGDKDIAIRYQGDEGQTFDYPKFTQEINEKMQSNANFRSEFMRTNAIKADALKAEIGDDLDYIATLISLVR